MLGFGHHIFSLSSQGHFPMMSVATLRCCVFDFVCWWLALVLSPPLHQPGWYIFSSWAGCRSWDFPSRSRANMHWASCNYWMILKVGRPKNSHVVSPKQPMTWMANRGSPWRLPPDAERCRSSSLNHTSSLSCSAEMLETPLWIDTNSVGCVCIYNITCIRHNVSIYLPIYLSITLSLSTVDLSIGPWSSVFMSFFVVSFPAFSWALRQCRWHFTSAEVQGENWHQHCWNHAQFYKCVRRT